MPHSAILQSLYKQARAAMNRAYNPYSKYGVGAALTSNDDQVFVGCNVENVSYGLTLCAERNAITSMIASLGTATIKELLIVVTGDDFPAPCGACRQVMAEFALPETQIHLVRPKQDDPDNFEVRTYRMGALLPLSFTQQVMWGEQAKEKLQEKKVVVHPTVYDKPGDPNVPVTDHEIAQAGNGKRMKEKSKS